jgi:hypothetical protein
MFMYRLAAVAAFLALISAAPCLAQNDIVLSDFNGDGTLDTLTSDGNADTVTLRTNDGTGTFSSGTSIALTAGDLPVAVSAGNLVIGGGVDAAVACQTGDVVRILSNNPIGNLTVGASISVSPIGANPVDVRVGDLNNSGPDDLVIALEGELLIAGLSGVAVSLDGGPATLLTPPGTGFGTVRGCDISDLDGDGDNDLVCTMAASAFVPGVLHVLLYENDGNGNFAAPVVLTTSQEPKKVRCFDIDGDQDADVLVTTQNLLAAGELQIFLNNGLTAGAWGAGSFGNGGSYAGGTGPLSIAGGDIGDNNVPGFYHRNDVVVANPVSGDVTHFSGFVNAGTGFEAINTFAAGDVPMGVAIGELNGDYTPDMVIANSASANVTVVLTDPLAQVKVFGTGCPGSGGLVPSIGTVGLPVAGSTTFALTVSDGKPQSPVVLGLSLSQATTPLSGGCTVYLGLSFSLISPGLTDNAGSLSLVVPIPGSASAFFGREAFFQFLVADEQGAYLNRWAFSDAVRIKVAN